VVKDFQLAEQGTRAELLAAGGFTRIAAVDFERATHSVAGGSTGTVQYARGIDGRTGSVLGWRWAQEVNSRGRMQPILKPKEPELKRGNRVLVGLFVAVALLGPSFTTGYILGYRSGETSGTALVTPPDSALPVQTVSHQSAPTRQKPAARVRTKSPAPVVQGDQPAGGQIYLQLAAAAEHPSAVILDALRNNGFATIAVEVPEQPGLYRVLVGPVHEGDLDKTRAALQRRGFPGGSAIKRIF
jgi:hypothetical protein